MVGRRGRLRDVGGSALGLALADALAMPLAAAAQAGPSPKNLATVLAPAPTGFEPEDDSHASLEVGPISGDDIANSRDPSFMWQGILYFSHFTRAYGLGWIDSKNNIELIEDVYAFDSYKGALFFWTEDEYYDQTGVALADRITDDQLDIAYGVRYRHNQVEDDWIEFVKGNLVLVVYTAAGQSEVDLVRQQAWWQYALPPRNTRETWNNPIPLAQIGVVFALLALLLVGMFWLVLRAATGRPQTTMAPPGAHISPDGMWWWDGYAWRPTRAGPPP